MDNKQIQLIKLICNDILDQKLSNNDACSIFRILSFIRNVKEEMIEDTDKVLYDLFQYPIESKYAYLPIDVIELRYLLENNSASKIINALFSYKFARKYFQDYLLLMCIDISDSSCDIYGGVVVNTEQIALKDKLKRLYIHPRLDEEIVKQIKAIFNEEEVHVDIVADIQVPGTYNPKFSAVLNRYIVNIGGLDIKDAVMNATSEEEAISEAVNRKWNRVRESVGFHYRPYKYRTSTWLKFRGTPFWNMMVRGDKHKKRKVAQSGQLLSVNDQEKSIFEFLIRVKNSFPQLKPVQLRVAGGWVRDKLMGGENDDIDIAISHISGYDFAKYVEKYAKMHDISDVSEAYSVSLDKLVDRSQVKDDGLKVGGISIFGLKIEFTSLRTEVYDKESRTPKIVATNDVKEDVMRRDLTINSLYYNLETQQVEDYVNGLYDLKNKILKTPTDPISTFSDDPLRMLRVLRFAARFDDFSIDPLIIDVMRQSQDLNSQFAQNYIKKVAPSRSSKEIRKMMSAADPVRSIELMLTSGFYKLVFNVPQEWHFINMDQQNPYHNMSLLDHTIGVVKNIKAIAKDMNLPDEERGLLLLAALFHDFGKMSPDIRRTKTDKTTGLPRTLDREEGKVERMYYIGHEKASSEFTRKIMEAMGFTPEEKKFVEMVVSGHMDAHAIGDAVDEYEKRKSEESPLVEQYTNEIESLRARLSVEKDPQEQISLKKEIRKLERQITNVNRRRRSAKERMDRRIGLFLRSLDKETEKMRLSLENIKSDPRIQEEERIAKMEETKQWIGRFETLWNRIMMHGLADDLSKEKLSEEDVQRIDSLRRKYLDIVRSYKAQIGQLTHKMPEIEFGNVIREIALEMAPELANSNGVISDKRIKKPVHYIKFIIEKILEQQHMGYIKTVEQAKEFIRSNMKGWENLWKQQRQASWYGKIVEADASSGQDPAGFGIGEGAESPLERLQGQYYMNRGNVPLPFNVGDKVRLKFIGLAFPQCDGRVKRVMDNNAILVEWETGKNKGRSEEMTMDKAMQKLIRIE